MYTEMSEVLVSIIIGGVIGTGLAMLLPAVLILFIEAKISSAIDWVSLKFHSIIRYKKG